MKTRTKMLQFIKKDPKTYKAFREFVELVKKNGLPTQADYAENRILDLMLKANCLNDLQHTKNFIIYHRKAVKQAGPLIKTPRGFGG